MPEVVRTNVYGRDGTVLWSSDAQMTGRRFANNDELEEALAGKVVYKRGYVGEDKASDPKPEHQSLPTGTFFIESYIPIYGLDAQPVAVVELYKAARKLEETLRTAQSLVWSSSVAGGLLLFLVLHRIIRKAARQIQVQQARLVEAESMAAVGVMGSAIAHGIRNPLASIRSSAELAADTEDCTWREQAEDIIVAADRIERSVRDLLHFSRPASDPMLPIELNNVAADSVEGLMRELGRRGLASILELDPGNPKVLADASMLGQVVSSLIVNAMEASSANGKVTVRTRIDSHLGTASLDVEDSGHGISPQDLPLVLRAFHTTKPTGLGLGLPLAKRIVERFGGTLAIDSAKGRGTTVRLQFPVAA
jgi:signal transduction histidine kinase